MKLDVKMEKSCGAVIWREQDGLPRVLVLQHQNGGHWAFPKGHVEGRRPRSRPPSVRSLRRQVLR